MSDISHALDVVSSQGVAGWAVAGDADVKVIVSIDGVDVGEARRDIWRPDVRAAHPDVPEGFDLGFAFALSPRHFEHVDGGFADVAVSLVASGSRVRTDPVRVPVPRAPAGDVPSWVPLPPGVSAILATVQGDRTEWDEERALADLATIVNRGSKREHALYAFLGYIAQVWNHARYVERNFPRINPTYMSGDKDAVGVLTSPEELLAIATHMATLHAHGHRGNLLEFGCFKGFSTCVLSFASGRLGIEMEVFDSFEGLPESDSEVYRAGEFAGGLEEVKGNVNGLGWPDRVRFHKGFFADSLPRWERTDVLMIWMDVDLESSSLDVMEIFEELPRESAIFSHECMPWNFVDGRVESTRSPDAVLPPILDRYAAAGRTPTGRYLAGNTGVVWDAESGVPVLSLEALQALRDLALGT